MTNTTLYGGCYILGTNYIYNYGMQKNIPKNIHDITKTRLSYSAVATNIRRMIPKSMVSSVIGFADQLQLTHLKIQQAIAKAKPDGLIIDIEGLENVQLGRGGELQPLEIQDIYEQTGIFYYRSKNPEGGFQNPPVRPIENAIRNIEQFVNLYNHYLRMIRDTTGINEVMDGSTPKGDALVGVRQQQMMAGNNAIYDITNAANVLYKKVAEDIVRCLQIIPEESILYRIYANAIGETNMGILASFKELPMYNFGVRIVSNMDDNDRAYLEQNIQIALSSGEIDLEDAIAIRNLKDIDQAERLLIVRRKKRVKSRQQMQLENINAQAQANQQSAQVAMQTEMQKSQVENELKLQQIVAEAQAKERLLNVQYGYELEIARIRSGASTQAIALTSQTKAALDREKEDRKDERVDQQAIKQSQLIAQRQGQRPPLEDEQDPLMQILGNQ